MFFPIHKFEHREFIPIANAVLCLDCEAISQSRSGECIACQGHSLVSLARLLSGRLLDHRVTSIPPKEGSLFDISITLELKHLQAKDLNAVVESLDNLIESRHKPCHASCHLDVQPSIDTAGLIPAA